MNHLARVAFIDVCGWQGATTGNRPFPNIGLAYLVSILKNRGHEVLLVDLNNEVVSNNDILDRLVKFNPRVIGFSIKTATMQNARTLGMLIKEQLPNASNVVGGPHATVAGNDIIQEPWIDLILTGEGEEVFPLVCESICSKDAVDTLPGVMTKSRCKNIGQIDIPRIDDLESLPFPDYDSFPMCVKESIRKSYPIVTSRGCVHRCIYCSVPAISGRKFRRRSPQNIIQELKVARHKYCIEGFEIIDDAFNLDMARAKEFCHALIRENLGLIWTCPNGLRADKVDVELATLMRAAGCSSVMVGIESAVPDMLRKIKKGETLSDIERGISCFVKAGISVGGYFIIGLPGDSFKAQEMSVKFAKKYGLNAHFNMLVPYPGTELWEWAKSNARFLRNIEEGMHFSDSSAMVNPVFESDDFTEQERRRTYEMVHTRLRRFDMIIPRMLSRSRYYRMMGHLIWMHDRAHLLHHIIRESFNMLRNNDRNREVKGGGK